MPVSPCVIGVGRAQRYSPNSADRDAAVLQAVATCLEARDCRVMLVGEEDFTTSIARKADAVFSMARSREALALLESLSLPIINPPVGLRNARRSVLTDCFAEYAVPMPPTWTVQGADNLPEPTFPCWLKRADACAQSADDVCYVENQAQLRREWVKFQKKGIKEAIVCKHVTGDLLKFYGVEGSGFFYFYYPTADGGFSKFGLERHNGKAHKYAFDTARLTAEAERASRLLHLPVYGGDCIVEPDGSFYFIDFNDWPSFSCCREAASAAIAARVLRAIEHNESFRNYEQQPGSDIQVAGYGRMA